jgi:hypothetical protein
MIRAWSLLASLLICGNAAAMPIEFTIDLDLEAVPPFDPAVFDQPFPDAGHLVIDSSFLAGSGPSLVPFSAVQDFSLRVENFAATGDDLRNGLCISNRGTLLVALPDCGGLAFTGTSFQGVVLRSEVHGFFFSAGNRNFFNLNPAPPNGLAGTSTLGVFQFAFASALEPIPVIDSVAFGPFSLRTAPAPVPEPASAAALLLGGLMIARAYGQRRTARSD